MSQPVKVLVVISNLSHGGAERQVVELANRIDRSKVDLHLCSLSHHTPLREYLRHPDKLHVLEKKQKYDLALILKLAKFLKAGRFDVVHGFLFDAEIASRIAGLIARTPKIIGSERNSKNHFSRLKTAIYRYTSPCIDLCVANSNAGMEFSHNAFGIPRNKYRVIRNGVDTERFSPAESQITRDALGIPKDARVVGMIASYKRQKNHALLLRAAARLKELNFRLLIVGSAIREGSEPTVDYFNSVQALVDELGIRDKCVFMEARNDVEQVYRFCDVTVLPSLFEGTPNVALESMACGVPVIATDVADNRTVIPDQKAGFIVSLEKPAELADCLKRILGDSELHRSLANTAREWAVEQFSFAKMAFEFEKLYCADR